MQFFSPNHIRVNFSLIKNPLDAIVHAYIGERQAFYWKRPKAYATTFILAKALDVSTSRVNASIRRLLDAERIVFAEFGRKRVYYLPAHECELLNKTDLRTVKFQEKARVLFSL